MPPAFAGAPLAYDAAHSTWQATGTIINVPAMVVVIAVTAVLTIGVRESARVNNVIVATKLVIIVCSSSAGRAILQLGALGHGGEPGWAFHSAQHRRRPIRLAALCAAPPWSSSPISASTLSRRRRRRRTIRSATCRSASSGRSSVCTVLYLAVGFVLTGIVSLRQAQRRRSDRRRHQCHRADVARAGHEARHHLRPDLGHPRRAAGSAAHRLFDGERRPVAAGFRRQGASAVPHALSSPRSLPGCRR
jgi:hypothetical protein